MLSRARLRAAAALVLLAASASVARAGALAVVVHPEVEVEGLSLGELRDIALAERQFWSAGRPITLIVRHPVAPERTLLLERVYRMTEAEYEKYWWGKIFRAEASEKPRVVLSNEEAVDLVGVIEGSITLVAAADVPEGLKVLRIDGRLPGQAGYLFTSHDD